MSSEILRITKNIGVWALSVLSLPAQGKRIPLKMGKRGKGGKEKEIQSFGASLLHQTHLPDHLWEIVHIGGAQGLCLETLGLEQVLGDVGGVDEHPVLRPLLVPVRLEHDLERRAERWGGTQRGGTQRRSLHSAGGCRNSPAALPQLAAARS